MAITFFKTPRNKQFNYKPVFWDKRKEEREKRMKSALDESAEGKDYAEALRERMEMRWKRNAGARSKSNSNFRLIAILLGLAFVFYIVFLR